MPHSTPDKRREYRSRPETKALIKISDRKQYLTNKKAMIERRRDLLSLFSCIACGENEPCCIDWHHINDETKSFNIGTGMMRNEEVWWDELLKCVPLCSNCHRKLHNHKLCLLPQKL